MKAEIILRCSAYRSMATIGMIGALAAVVTWLVSGPLAGGAVAVGAGLGVGLELVTLACARIRRGGSWVLLAAYVLKLVLLLAVLALVRGLTPLDEVIVALVAAAAIVISLGVQTLTVIRMDPR